MRKASFLLLMFGFILILASPIFAQEALEEAAQVEEVGIEGLADEGVITGEVTSLDADAGTITVKADVSENTFSVIDGETILWKGIEDIELSDVSIGMEAEVGYYTNENKTLIASWVDVLIEEDVLEIDLSEEAEGISQE
ncbi:MAG: hypothetical protein HQ532_01820 [Candidatus Omnitrophica bacterium]|nr:hypothetical protein [Candidatus Omnitrophota bacterium]